MRWIYRVLLAFGLLCCAAPGLAQPRPTFSSDGLPETLPDEIAVDFADETGAAEIASIGSSLGIRLVANSPLSTLDGVVRATVAPGRRDTVLAELKRDPRVQSAEPMVVLHASFVPNDPLYAPLQWHLRKVGAERAWDYGCGSGVTVAVIDTGVACYDRGPFAKGSDLNGTKCVAGHDFVRRGRRPSDDHGHGTHVAGTIAQTTHNERGVAGVAYCARLMPVKVLDRRGMGRVTDVAQGVRWAASHGARVINLSLGSPLPSSMLKRAIDEALEQDVIVVAAAGNTARSVGYPARYPGVIAVSATKQDDSLAWFSSRGKQIAFGAPGVEVTQQTVCEAGRNKCELFGTFNGTSMASPHVAGAAAVLVGMGVSRPAAVRSTLERTARRVGERKHFGAGIVDVGAAARSTYIWRTLWRALSVVLIGGWVVRRIRRKRGRVSPSPLAWLAVLAASLGVLFPAPLLGLRPAIGAARLPMELLMAPLGTWDGVLLGANVHRWLPLANALVPFGLTLVGFGNRRLRPVVGGLALGMAALLVQLAIGADVASPLGAWGLRLWLLVNVVPCVWIARMGLDASKR